VYICARGTFACNQLYVYMCVRQNLQAHAQIYTMWCVRLQVVSMGAGAAAAQVAKAHRIMQPLLTWLDHKGRHNSQPSPAD
jgi:hypothetical protein